MDCMFLAVNMCCHTGAGIERLAAALLFWRVVRSAVQCGAYPDAGEICGDLTRGVWEQEPTMIWWWWSWWMRCGFNDLRLTTPKRTMKQGQRRRMELFCLGL